MSSVFSVLSSASSSLGREGRERDGAKGKEGREGRDKEWKGIPITMEALCFQERNIYIPIIRVAYRHGIFLRSHGGLAAKDPTIPERPGG
jgi:hypothetical protein